MDEELLLRTRAALEAGDGQTACRLLDAAHDRESSQWLLLKGKACLLEEDYTEAARCFHAAETENPKETAPLLERCYRELGDFRMAYEYACKQRG